MGLIRVICELLQAGTNGLQENSSDTIINFQHNVYRFSHELFMSQLLQTGEEL